MKNRHILRRLLSFGLSLLLILSIFGAVPVYATGITEIIFGETIGEAGDEVIIPITIKNNPGIASFRFRVSYDIEKFEFISATEGEMLTNGTISDGVNAQSKILTFQWFSESNVYGDGELVQLSFKALKASPGEHQLNVTYLENDIVNENLKPIPFVVNVEKFFVFCSYADHKFLLNGQSTCSICKFSKSPSIPVLESKTDTIVTLVGTTNYEYSKDGNIWQSSNVFNDLLPDTKYTFYQRVSKTDTSFLSEASIPLNVTTYKVCEVDARLHIYDNDCDVDCNRCGATRTTTHNYEWIVDKSNNCGVNGTKHEECSVCHLKCNENTVIPATGNHTYDNACDKVCNVCEQTRTVGEHKYNNTCDTTCNICGATRTITHKYEWIVDKSNNCGVNGIKHEECSVCHLKRNENTVILATENHTYDNACDFECNICKQIRSVPEHNYGNDTICDECGYKKYTPGDTNDDGVVSLTDIVALAQFVAGWDIECNELALDTNGDGNVDLTDIVHLAQYVAGWDVELN